MTNDEICKECESVWIKTTGFDWTLKELKSLLGYLDRDEEVTLKSGEVLTGSLVTYWHNDWHAFAHGWVKAYKHLGHGE